MSDISKRILSIDPEEDIRPSKAKPLFTKQDDVPQFITRPAPVFSDIDEESGSGKWLFWIGLLLSLIWLGMSLTYFILNPIAGLRTFEPIALLTLFAIVVFPALTLLLFFIAAYKLRQTVSEARTLAKISQNLLKADDAAIGQVENLAQAIRKEMNGLNADVSTVSKSIQKIHEETQQQSSDVNKSAKEISKTSVTISNALNEQNETLETIIGSTEARLAKLSEFLGDYRTKLETSTQSTASLLTDAANVMGEKTSGYSDLVHQFKENMAETTVQLTTTESDAKALVERVEEQSKILAGLIDTLKNEKSEIESELDSRAQQIENIAKAQKEAKEVFDQTIDKSLEATSQLTSEISENQRLLTLTRDELDTLLKKAQSQSTALLQKQDTEILSMFGYNKAALEDLETRISRLQDNTASLEADYLSKAPTQDMGLEIPQHSPKKTSTPLKLKPIEEELQAEVSTIYEKTNLNVGKKDTLEEEIALPFEAETPLALDEDIVQPVTETGTLFNKSKKKEKSSWNWRDMLGGFDPVTPETADNTKSTPKEHVTTAKKSPVETQTPIKQQSFRAWLNEFELDPNVIVSDGAILDYSNALTQNPETTLTALDKRLPDVSAHLMKLAKEHQGFEYAAKIMKAEFSPSLNPEIMNRDAIRNHISSWEGKAYLLALLVAK